MRNLKLTLEYDGSDFFGWQVQPEVRTVQGVLGESLRCLLQEPVKIIGAGRTDAGVHALGQVANFNTESGMLLREIYRGLNSLLPSDMIVQRVENAPEKFHARYDATSRCYLYRISSRPTALHRHFVWTVLTPLDVSQMRQAAEVLLGAHDFSGFCLGPGEKSHCRCAVESLSVRRAKGEIHFRIEADRFLRAMVRVIVGRLVEVGRGHLSQNDFLTFLKKGSDRQPIAVAPAQGLCLLKVKYAHAAKQGKGVVK
jgi:tRNA pseudouridine38-40 synthase